MPPRKQSRAGKPGYVGRRGRWHPASWWFGHHDTRDACGEYTPDANMAGPCSPRHNTGRHAGWGSQRQLPRRRGKATPEREHHREAMRLAKHAQDLRAEDITRGYRTELRGFYGDPRVATGETSERRVRVRDADEQMRRYRRGQGRA